MIWGETSRHSPEPARLTEVGEHALRSVHDSILGALDELPVQVDDIDAELNSHIAAAIEHLEIASQVVEQIASDQDIRL